MKALMTLIGLLCILTVQGQKKPQKCETKTLIEVKELLAFEKFEEALERIKQTKLDNCPENWLSEEKLNAIKGIKQKSKDSIELELIQIYIHFKHFEAAKSRSLKLLEDKPLLSTKMACLELLAAIENQQNKDNLFFDSITFDQAGRHIDAFRYNEGIENYNQIKEKSNKKIAAIKTKEAELSSLTIIGQIGQWLSKNKTSIFLLILVFFYICLRWLFKKRSRSKKILIVEESKSYPGYKGRFELLFHTMNTKYEDSQKSLFVNVPDKSRSIRLDIWEEHDLVELESAVSELKYLQWAILFYKRLSKPDYTLTYSIEKDEKNKHMSFRAIFVKKSQLLFPYNKTTHVMWWYRNEDELIYDLVYRIHTNINS
ncbi:hypothetical protein AB9K32_07775 [Allomuricauda sp. XS_ASV26]|uniref:hypothetical protein n=1 Tax=Allomuricauda sp. XS_ASV26 TaxID=3241292 RepID=UPI003519990A